MSIAVRAVALLIGYVCGLFQTGYFYSKSQGVDIQKEGSGNVGTTNTMRVLGLKAGILTFLGDFFKTVLAVVIVFLLFYKSYGSIIRLLMLYAGFGAILGHNFPFYMHFKGGKGIACTAGVIGAVLWWDIPTCLLTFIITVVITRYVSLGSVLVVLVLFIENIIVGQMGIIDLSGAALIEFYIVSGCLSGMAIWRHRENIKRLIHGTENKASIGSKNKSK
ncbi:MAG: glycerol-3-phosphate 1-O-acyltransferase PlsY [Clostridiales bacterium]|nr:glycerol-3-phosphate 1-O-acyltransferase PlsY [Clostridiales bacterium]